MLAGAHARALREDQDPDAGREPLASLVEHLVDRAVTGAAVDADAFQQPRRPTHERDPQQLALEDPGLGREHDHLRDRFPGRGVLPHRDVRALPRDVLTPLDDPVETAEHLAEPEMPVRPGPREMVELPERQPAEQHDREAPEQRIGEQHRRENERAQPLHGRESAPRGHRRGRIPCAGLLRHRFAVILDVYGHPNTRRFSRAGGRDWRCAGTISAARRAAQAGSRGCARRPPSPAPCRRTHPRPGAARRGARVRPRTGAT